MRQLAFAPCVRGCPCRFGSSIAWSSMSPKMPRPNPMLTRGTYAAYIPSHLGGNWMQPRGIRTRGTAAFSFALQVHACFVLNLLRLASPVLPERMPGSASSLPRSRQCAKSVWSLAWIGKHLIPMRLSLAMMMLMKRAVALALKERLHQRQQRRVQRRPSLSLMPLNQLKQHLLQL